MFRFTRMTEADLPMVLAWRTKPRVAERMFTVVENDMEKQRAWFRGLTHPHWVINHYGRPIGLLCLASVGSWGFYIGEDYATALGGFVPPYFYNHWFADPEHLVLFADVKEDNAPVIKMHEFHGYWGHPKDGVWNGFITRRAWLAQSSRYGHYIAEFE